MNHAISTPPNCQKFSVAGEMEWYVSVQSDRNTCINIKCGALSIYHNPAQLFRNFYVPNVRASSL